MDSTIPVHPAIQRASAPFPPAMGQQPFNPQMMPPTAMRMQPYFPAQMMNPALMSEKDNEFSKGIYVSGFERSLTSEMLEKHFKIKPITGMKLPLTKYQENKGFAFIYYNSKDDAAYVKESLDHTVILINKIRVTKTVNAEHLSKMMFKLKTTGKSDAQLKDIKEKIFNEKNLETQVSKIIEPYFGTSVEVNKILIPRSKGKQSQNPLPYARGFFHISNIKEASRKVNILDQSQDKGGAKKDYELVLQFIVEKLNTNPDFSKYVEAQIYEYANKNKPNILHIKNINAKHDQDPLKISEELKNFIQGQKQQANITSCFVAMFGNEGAWANVGFSNFDEAQDLYNHIKNNRIKFRDSYIYATLKNYKDLRTVVISPVHQDASRKDIQAFLNKLAERSPRFDPADESKGRKLDYISFNILSRRTYYHCGDGNASVGLTEGEQPKEHWKEQNTVPRRIVVHFWNEIQEKDVKLLLNDIKITQGWQKIFFEKDSKNSISANHQKGHIEGDKYVRHAQLNRKKELQPRENRPKAQRDGNKKGIDANQFQMNRGPRPMGGAPRVPQTRPGGMGGPPRSGALNPAFRQQGQPPISRGPMGSLNIPPGAGIINPKVGAPVPQIGGMQVSQMGVPPKPISGLPPMGGNMPPMGLPQMGLPPMGGSLPPMGGNIPPMGLPQMGLPPMGGNLPPMGGNLPPMGGMQVPQMGARIGTVPPANIPQIDKKQ